MPNAILHKRGTTVPGAASLLTGELAINTATGVIYTKTDGGTVVAVNGAPINNPTFTGKVTTAASTTAGAGLNLPHGTAPTAPVNGDIWTTTTSLQWRRNGTTATVANSSLANTFSAGQKQTVSHSATNAGFRVAPIAGDPSTLVDGDVWHNLSTLKLVARVNGVSQNIATESFVTSQGYITSAALTGYATESWVTSQGYLTSAPVTSVAGKTGAVTLAVADVSGAAPTASPTFTGTPSLPTGTTAVTQAAGNNTTAVATTAFVQQEVPAASTTAAGKVELATNAEALTATSTTLAVTADDIPWALSNGMVQRLDFINNTSIAGSGSVTTPNAGYRQIFTTGGSSSGRASFAAGSPGTLTVVSGLSNFRQINFSKKIWLCGKFTAYLTGIPGDANNFFSISLGGYSSLTTGPMTSRGIGLKKTGGASSVIELVVHNGTSQTVVATTKTNAENEVIEWVIYSDGTGNVTLYLNGSQAATSSAGPTGSTADTAGVYREQVEQTTSAINRIAANCYGGQVIIER